jgi:hypothetical protein
MQYAVIGVDTLGRLIDGIHYSACAPLGGDALTARMEVLDASLFAPS